MMAEDLMFMMPKLRCYGAISVTLYTMAFGTARS